jgi:hypothetical protein
MAFKRQLTTETSREIVSGSTIVVSTMRAGFAVRGADAVAIAYNVNTGI